MRLWPSRRLAWILAAALAVSVGLCAAAVWGVRRALREGQARYHAEMARLCGDHERRLREVVVALRRDDPGRDPCDEAFALIRVGRLAANSREVTDWARRPPSPERKGVALKWAEYTAEESAAMAARHTLWKRDYDRGRTPHDVTNDEVREPDPPAGWTPADLSYR